VRTLLIISALTTVLVHGGETTAPTMRQKLQARIMESVPPAPPPSPSPDPKPGEETVAPPVMMQPVIVSDSKLIRAVTAAIDREEQDRREEQFSPLAGGKIGTLAGMQVGGWWSAGEGWTFLRLNKTPTYRQTQSVEARLKELQELLKIGEKSKR
jgi:hypothetical protein